VRNTRDKMKSMSRNDKDERPRRLANAETPGQDKQVGIKTKRQPKRANVGLRSS
jgi:hypothetical protein